MKLLNRVAIVTGGGTGIGRVISHTFANEGARVVIATEEKTIKDANVVSQEIISKKGESLVVKTDISEYSQLKSMVEKVLNKWERIDILVNNAYWAGENSKALDISEEEWDKTMGVTLKGPFLASKLVIPLMIKEGGGVIINISSIAGLVYWPYPGTAYSAAKAGLIQLTRSLAADYGKNNIRVNAICPGTIETPATAPYLKNPEIKKLAQNNNFMGRIAQPEEIATAALFLASADSSYMTGAVMVVDGGTTAM